jgi:hypothetical protein
MKKGTRRILFWIAAIVFVVASWAAIRYAQGYAYDFDTGTFVRTGAVAVTVSTQATLFIDDVKSGTTSFIGNRAGKEGLLPGIYSLRVAREDYTTWHKSVAVEEGRLVDFPNVLILPTDDVSLLSLKEEASDSLREVTTLQRANPRSTLTPLRIQDGNFILEENKLFDARTASPSLIAEHVLGFAQTKDQSRILWWTRNEVWVLWLRNTDHQPYRVEGERQAITRFSVRILGAAWFRGTEHIVVDLGNQSYRVIETDARGGTNIIKL